MKAQKKFILSAGLLVILIGAWLIVVFFPTIARISNAQSQTHQYTSQIDSAFAASKNMDLLNQKLLSTKTELDSRARRFIRSSNIYSLATRFTSLFSEDNLQLMEFSPNLKSFLNTRQAESKPAGLQRLPVTVKLKGTFFDFVKLLDNLNSKPLAINPEGISINRHGGYTDDITITFNFSIYVDTRS